MTGWRKRQTIEHMWKVASGNPHHDTNWHDPVVIAFAELVRADEREKFLGVLRQLHDSYSLASDPNGLKERGQA